MSSNVNKRFLRQSGTKQENPVVLVAPEGAKTEITYLHAVIGLLRKAAFDRFQRRINVSLVSPPPNHSSSPMHRHKELKNLIKNCASKSYTAWQLCDRDAWENEDFEIIKKWAATDTKRRYLILSAPKFEFWLELHFDTGTKEGRDALSKFGLNHHKEIKDGEFTYEQVVRATRKARALYASNSDLQVSNGSQMFLLIEFLANVFGLENDFKSS